MKVHSSVKVDLSGLKKLKTHLKKLEAKEIEWGFLYGTHSKADLSYAALAWMLEEGVRSNFGGWSIPPRPAFKSTISTIKNTKLFDYEMQKDISNFMYGKVTANYLLNETGKFATSLHKDTMTSWISSGSQYKHNSPITIEIKGFDMPFVDTGELVQNVKYQIT